jgi:hypothetical protein
MCTVIAAPVADLPAPVFEAHGLGRRVRRRDGREEVRFAYADPDPRLPVRVGREMRVLRWGWRGRAGPLPPTGWMWRASVADGA